MAGVQRWIQTGALGSELDRADHGPVAQTLTGHPAALGDPAEQRRLRGRCAAMCKPASQSNGRAEFGIGGIACNANLLAFPALVSLGSAYQHDQPLPGLDR